MMSRRMPSYKTTASPVINHVIPVVAILRSCISYTIKSADHVIVLGSKDFQGLQLIAFVATTDTPISCDGLPKPLFAVISYIPASDPKTKTSGELISIELVPDDFRFLGETKETGM